MVGEREARRRRRASERHVYGLRGSYLATAFALVGLCGGSSAKAQTAAELVEVTDISGLSASPDGSTIAFRTERAALDANSYVLAWHVLPLASGSARRLADGGAPVYEDPGRVRREDSFWSPDSRFLFFRALVDRRIGLWRAAADGHGAEPVVVGDANVEDVQGEAGGRSLLLRFGPTRDQVERAERREYDDGILVDPSVDLTQSAYRGAYIEGRLATQRLTGYWFTRGALLWAKPRRLRRLDLVTLQLSDAGDFSPKAPRRPKNIAAPPVVIQSAGGATATLVRGASSDSLFVRRPGSSTTVNCTASACVGRRIASVVWRPGHDELLLTTENGEHDQDLYLWTVGTPTARLLAGGDGLLNGGRDHASPCAVTAGYAVCVAAGPLSPPRLDRIDLDTGERQAVFEPNAELGSSGNVGVQRLRWTAAEGRTFYGLLFRRRDDRGPTPIVINYYRCDGYVRGGVGDELPFAPLAAAGVATLCIDSAPLSDPYKAEASYRTALAGIRTIVARLAGKGIVDPTRVGMSGLSFGSEVAMWTAMKSDLLAAVSISSTQFEPGYYWFNAVSGRDQPQMLEQVWGLGAPDVTPAAWKRMSPALNVDQLRAPILMQLPEQEARDVAELYARLSRSTTPAELYVFPNEAHIKIEPRHKLAVYRRNLDWFRFWLQGYEDPDPGRADQYARWRALAAPRGASSQERSQSSDAASSITRK